MWSVQRIYNEVYRIVVKVNTETGQSGAVNKTSLESTAQNDNFQQVKRRKRRISNDASETTMKSTKSVPILTTVKHTKSSANSQLR
jgi:hypothetical protein